MMLHKSLLAALLVSAAPMAALAEVSGDITLSFGQTDVQDTDTDLSTTYLGFSSTATLGSNIVAGLDLSTLRVGLSDVDADVDLVGLGLDLGYRFDAGMTLGAYVQRNKISASVLDLDLGEASATSTGLTVGYQAQGIALSGFYGETTTDPSLDDQDSVTDLGLHLRADPSDELVLGAALVRSTLDTPTEDFDLNSMGVATGMQVTETWSLFAGANRAELDGVDLDLTDVGFGIGYAMPFFPGVIFAEISRATLSDGIDEASLDTIQLGMTFPLGGGKASMAGNTVAGGILTPTYSSVAQAVRLSF